MAETRHEIMQRQARQVLPSLLCGECRAAAVEQRADELPCHPDGFYLVCGAGYAGSVVEMTKHTATRFVPDAEEMESENPSALHRTCWKAAGGIVDVDKLKEIVGGGL